MILAEGSAGADVWQETVTEASMLAALPLPLALLSPPPIYAALKRKGNAGGWTGAPSSLGPPRVRVRVPGGDATPSECVRPRQGEGDEGSNMQGTRDEESNMQGTPLLAGICAAWYPLATPARLLSAVGPCNPADLFRRGMQRARVHCGLGMRGS